MIANLGLISKFVTTQTGQQTFAIHLLSNISRSKGKQAIKFSQLIKHSVRNHAFFKKNHAENEIGKLVSDLFLLLEKGSYVVTTEKQFISHFNYNIFWQTVTSTRKKKKLYNIHTWCDVNTWTTITCL